MDSDSLFSDCYATARDRFRNEADKLGWERRSYPIELRGPKGEELTIDVAFGAKTTADPAVVISGGIHGVEGFFGAAVQLALLREWAKRKDALPPVRLVLLHGLNPFGFAWRRRCNEANVDLNRNLLLDGESFRGSPQGYSKFDALLNPKRSPSHWEPATLKILFAIVCNGMAALKEAVASGQYDYAQGLFYGGDRPSRTNEVLAAHLDEWLGSSRKVVHLDFHTGLGKWANYKLLIDYPLDEQRRGRLSRWFGPGSFESTRPENLAYTVRGGFGNWCVSRNGGRDYTYAAAEFGTYSPIRILAGLRAENQAHHWGLSDDASTEQAKQRLVDLFCPPVKNWRDQALERSVRLVDQAIKGILDEVESGKSG